MLPACRAASLSEAGPKVLMNWRKSAEIAGQATCYPLAADGQNPCHRRETVGRPRLRQGAAGLVHGPEGLPRIGRVDRLVGGRAPGPGGRAGGLRLEVPGVVAEPAPDHPGAIRAAADRG